MESTFFECLRYLRQDRILMSYPDRPRCFEAWKCGQHLMFGCGQNTVCVSLESKAYSLSIIMHDRCNSLTDHCRHRCRLVTSSCERWARGIE